MAEESDPKRGMTENGDSLLVMNGEGPSFSQPGLASCEAYLDLVFPCTGYTISANWAPNSHNFSELGAQFAQFQRIGLPIRSISFPPNFCASCASGARLRLGSRGPLRLGAPCAFDNLGFDSPKTDLIHSVFIARLSSSGGFFPMQSSGIPAATERLSSFLRQPSGSPSFFDIQAVPFPCHSRRPSGIPATTFPAKPRKYSGSLERRIRFSTMVTTHMQEEITRLETLEENFVYLTDSVASIEEEMRASTQRLEERIDTRMEEIKALLAQNLKGKATMHEEADKIQNQAAKTHACQLHGPQAGEIAGSADLAPDPGSGVGGVDGCTTGWGSRGLSPKAGSTPILMGTEAQCFHGGRGTTTSKESSAGAVLHGFWPATSREGPDGLLEDQWEERGASCLHRGEPAIRESTTSALLGEASHFWATRLPTTARWSRDDRHGTVKGKKAELFLVIKRCQRANGCSYASFHLEDDAFQWTQWFLRGRDYVSWNDFVDGFTAWFGPLEYEDFEALLQKL
ncbi:hypothetical protein KSP39_PZI012836 [Platanthera zijinensis]|uniref:Uncharacterized protein n=1 Tax=Platanthera zijinensis TaxID=2320716 RepID=A0AAP0BHY4_9ASPA